MRLRLRSCWIVLKSYYRELFLLSDGQDTTQLICVHVLAYFSSVSEGWLTRKDPFHPLLSKSHLIQQRTLHSSSLRTAPQTEEELLTAGLAALPHNSSFSPVPCPGKKCPLRSVSLENTQSCRLHRVLGHNSKVQRSWPESLGSSMGPLTHNCPAGRKLRIFYRECLRNETGCPGKAPVTGAIPEEEGALCQQRWFDGTMIWWFYDLMAR